MTKVKWYTTCLKCGHTYHASSDCCPNCELEQSWRELAEWHKKQAQECMKTADLIAVEKAKEAARQAA